MSGDADSFERQLDDRRAARRQARRRLLTARLGAWLFTTALLAATGWVVYHHQLTGSWLPWGRAAVGAQPLRILIMGADSRPGDQGRADTMLLVTIEPTTKVVKVLSVPRDTRVDTSALGTTKLNAVYADGGPAQTVQVVSRFLGVPIDHYIALNFAGFARIVDTLGGVDIRVDEPMNYDDNAQNLHIHLAPGLQHLDGQTALEYVRYRGRFGDISLVDAAHQVYEGRITRQLEFIRALMSEAMKPQVLGDLPQLIGELRSAVRTDMSLTGLLALGVRLNDLKGAHLETGVVPGRGELIGGVSYWVTSPTLVSQAVARLSDGK